LALTRGTVTDTLTGALSVLVEITLNIRGINPSNLIRANALGAITRIVTHSDTVVIVTLAHIVEKTNTVAGARVIAAS
jgi:hypothetical protein